MVAKYDRRRCSRLVLEEKFSHVLGVFSWSPLFHWNRFSFLAAAISFPGKQNHCACPSSLFSPGWNSVSITWDFFRFWGPFGRAENPSPVWKTGLGFLARAEFRPGLNPSPCNRQFDFKRICFRRWAEISGQLTWPRFSNFSPRWNFPCNETLYDTTENGLWNETKGFVFVSALKNTASEIIHCRFSNAT